MKRALLMLVLAGCASPLLAQIMLDSQSFEDTLRWSLTHTFDDGNGNYAKRDTVFADMGFTPIGVDGKWFIGMEDTDGAAGISPTDGVIRVSFDSVDISGKSNIQVKLAVAANPTANRYDQVSQTNGDFFGVEAKIDNGPWTPIAAFIAKAGSNSGGLYQDLNANGLGGDAGEPMLDDTLKDYTFIVNGAGDYLYLRAGARMDAGDEEVAFDNLRVYGQVGTTVGFQSQMGVETEGSKSVWIKVDAANLISGTITCDAVLGASSTATDGVDFDFSSTQLSFSSASSTDSFKIDLKDDATIEAPEAIVIRLNNIVGSATFTLDSFVLVLNDNDFPYYSIEELRKNDGNGVSLYAGQKVWTSGIVNNDKSFSTSAVNVSLQSHGWGIATYFVNSNFAPVLGDSISVLATVSNFRGAAQLEEPDSIVVESSNNVLSPELTSVLDETTESKLIRINNLSIIDTSEWDNNDPNSSGFNIDVTNGTDTFSMRVDIDIDLFDEPVILGQFDLIGIGGQFDFTPPHDAGYQILPRSKSDVLLTVGKPEINGANVSIFPNPTQLSVSVQSPNPIESVRVYNAMGQEVERLNGSVTTIDFSGLDSGIYIVKGQDVNGAQFAVRVVKR